MYKYNKIFEKDNYWMVCVFSHLSHLFFCYSPIFIFVHPDQTVMSFISYKSTIPPQMINIIIFGP